MNQTFATFKKNIATFFFLLSFTLFVPTSALAQPQEWSDKCVYSSATGDVATIQGLECLIGNVFSIIITLIGFSGFIMFVIAAFKWLTSGGNTKGIESARSTMTYALVGIVVSLTAFIILNLLSEFTGVDEILQFKVPSSDM